jgi:cyclopropane-fatty-acyl-phospholipid synthase
MALAELLYQALGGDLPLRFELYDGSTAGPDDAKVRMVVHNERGLARFASRPGELGIARAYISGDVDIDGDLFAGLEQAAQMDLSLANVHPVAVARLLAATGPGVLRSPPPPPEEVRLSGGLHTRSRDRAAISHHYDVSNEFYRLVLGPSMVYSCALWSDRESSLEEAQAAKLELVSRKLALAPGMRLLDVGCGWGSMVIHAARHHGVRAVGVTISSEQATLARRRVEEAGVADRVEIRLQDYRDIPDGPFDAISSIGMFEHVGRNRMEQYVRDLHRLLAPGGRLLNHAISRPGYPQGDGRLGRAKALARRLATAVGSDYTSRVDSQLMTRYVFPDGELHEVGVVVSMLQENGFEVRHLESLREHYDLTLRHWVSNLESNWEAAVAEVGEGRARVWRIYMAACAVAFAMGGVSIEQVLAVKPDRGRSGLPLRPEY